MDKIYKIFVILFSIYFYECPVCASDSEEFYRDEYTSPKLGKRHSDSHLNIVPDETVIFNSAHTKSIKFVDLKKFLKEIAHIELYDENKLQFLINLFTQLLSQNPVAVSTFIIPVD